MTQSTPDRNEPVSSPVRRILLVTGKLAEEQVRSCAAGADVLVADVDVAAFITPKMLLSAAPRGYDLILIPGAITADFGEVERALNASIRLGPKHAADLEMVLDRLRRNEIDLSRTVPACQLILGTMREYANGQAERLERKASASMVIGGIKIGGSSRMKVLAEIVDATRFSSGALQARIRYYEEEGADMIDLGIPLDADVQQVKSSLKAAKEATNLPISIDTLVPELIDAGIEGGADLLLSLNGKSLPRVGRSAAEAQIPAVVIAGPGSVSLEDNLKTAENLAISAIADPVLDPPLLGLAGSIERYQQFRRNHPDTALFFGAGNVTELLDADTVGANALLAAIASEMGAGILFTPEYSFKARGSVRELAIASRMMQLGSSRRAPPKDLGLDLLILKEKRRLPEYELPKRSVHANGEWKFVPDSSGCFRIFISKGLIVAQNSETAVTGRSARDVLNTIIDMGLVSRLDHAGYLGRELERAEIALRLKRDYIQDEPLWPAEKS
jgi:dihydropteroate synthase-like protein